MKRSIFLNVQCKITLCKKVECEPGAHQQFQAGTWNLQYTTFSSKRDHLPDRAQMKKTEPKYVAINLNKLSEFPLTYNVLFAVNAGETWGCEALKPKETPSDSVLAAPVPSGHRPSPFSSEQAADPFLTADVSTKKETSLKLRCPWSGRNSAAEKVMVSSAAMAQSCIVWPGQGGERGRAQQHADEKTSAQNLGRA